MQASQQLQSDALAGLVPWAAVGSALLVSLRLGRMRQAARLVDAVLATGFALYAMLVIISPSLVSGVPSAMAGRWVVVAAGLCGAAFAIQSAVLGLRGLVFGATGAWAAVAGVATADAVVSTYLAANAAAWVVWAETARADSSARPTLATRRLMLTLLADVPLLTTTCFSRFASPDPSFPLATVLDRTPAGDLVLAALVCSGAARIGLFPLSLWKGPASDLGRGPAAVVGPFLAASAGLVLLAKVGSFAPSGPVSSALIAALPVSGLTLCLIAAAQRTRRSVINVAAAAATSFAALLLTTPAFPVIAGCVTLASATALLFFGRDERPLRLLPDGSLRRLASREFHLVGLSDAVVLPGRGVAQLARFADSLVVWPLLTGLPRRALAAVERNLMPDAAASGSEQLERSLLAGFLLTVALLTVWWAVR